ncbi:MAG TPA: 30S ribosomal protein S15 [archaeon]|nr:30S ribosomal protein S15 [archaeon]
MARVYSRKKGKSGSKKPMVKSAPWVKLKKEEVEEIIVKLAKKGHSSAEIGLILRDQYGIPSVRVKELHMKEKIAKIMKAHNAYAPFPEDMYNLLRKAVLLHAHMQKNKRDYTSKRGLQITESKIRRLAKYYKARGLLPADYKYDVEKAKLLVK